MCERSKCEECGRLIPSDSDLSVKAVVTTGRDEAVLGGIFRRLGRPAVAPSMYCPRCFLAAATRAIEALERATTLI